MRQGKYHIIDLTGQTFGDLLVLQRSVEKPKGHGSQAFWDCRCKCGRVISRASQALRTGRTKRCTDCGRPDSRVIGMAANELYAHYRGDARRKGKNRSVLFELTPEQFKTLILQNCFYCGVEPRQIVKRPHETLLWNGIDRVDSSLGYVLENCVPCCKICNYAKHNLSKEEFLIWLRRAYEHNYGKHN